MEKDLDLDFTCEEIIPEPDMCGCEECDWQGRIEDCEKEMDSEGWDYPEYTVWKCPACEDGYISDWWNSEDIPDFEDGPEFEGWEERSGK